MKIRGNGVGGLLAGRGLGVVFWRADPQYKLARPRKMAAFGPGLECAIKMAGNHGNIAAGQEHPDSGLEPAEFARPRAGPFREYDENITRIGEQVLAEREALADMNFAGERKGIDDRGGDPDAGQALEKVIRGGGGKGAVNFLQRQCPQETEGVEVARMICDHDERTGGGKALAADHGESVVDSQPAANHQRRE